jgi:AcrR family transcriptional regulator
MINDKQIQLIEAAEELFAENGYAEASIRDIARKASMNSAMISYYFGSKEKLMQAILDYRTADLAIVYAGFNEEKVEPLQRILAFVDFYVDKVFEQRYFYMIVSQLQSVGKEHLLLDYFNELRQKNHKMIQEMVNKGIENGTLQEDVDVSFLVSTVSGTINYIAFNQKNYKDLYHLEGMPQEEFVVLLKQKIKTYLEKFMLLMLKK